ncbi:hypothetical protein E2C01_079041 [Portunus trituberculatus]|uniref:Uncharacterized protein n=1 Tax=Portunus trituberculatus TaxID=210409 RepID=A0A5B7IVS4_PORTR|nr:hypothetical protein [Portunus trituberculatus]
MLLVNLRAENQTHAVTQSPINKLEKLAADSPSGAGEEEAPWLGCHGLVVLNSLALQRRTPPVVSDLPCLKEGPGWASEHTLRRVWGSAKFRIARGHFCDPREGGIRLRFPPISFHPPRGKEGHGPWVEASLCSFFLGGILAAVP